MPQGPFGGPRFSTLGPLSRQTQEDIKKQWDKCPKSGKPREICESIKFHALDIIQDQDLFPDCQTLIEINEGQCFDIAERVLNDVDGVEIWKIGDNDHVWIRYSGINYDAEVPSGVSNYIYLPIVQRIPDGDFLQHARNAAISRGDIPPETVDETIQEVTQEYA